MTPDSTGFAARIAELERSVRRTRFALGVMAGGLLTVVVAGFTQAEPTISEEVRTHRLVIVDDNGNERAILAQDPATGQRVSRAAGLVLLDEDGAERAGFSTMEDGSVVLALDAPAGVGAPMRDRIGLKVGPDGSAYVMLIDNQTRAVAKLESDGETGGVQVFDWDMDEKNIHIRTLTYEGDVRDTVSFGP